MFLVKESGKNLIKVYAEMPDIKWSLDLQMELNLSTVEYDLEIHIMFF